MSYSLFPAVGNPEDGKDIKLFLMDIDGTLITSRTGRRWAADATDWIFLGDVQATLERLRTEGWTIALVSNQSDWIHAAAKIESLLAALLKIHGWSPWCAVATAPRKAKDTLYRKPGRGLYDVLVSAIGKPVTEVRMCGDAVGPADPFPPYRWAASDAAFAAAIGATFLRPCDLFEPCKLPVPVAAGRELVLLMGNAGSGKSTTGRMFAAAGYVHVEQDVVGSKVKVQKAVVAALQSGKSVVVDATHASAVNRLPYQEIATGLGIPYRILWHIRDGRPFNALRPHPIPEVAYAMYSKYFVAPADATIIY